MRNLHSNTVSPPPTRHGAFDYHGAGTIHPAADPVALLAQHRRLLAAAAQFERLAAMPTPPRTPDDLWSLRWSFSRDMLLHFAHVQRTVLDPMMRDRRADVAVAALRSSADLRSVFEQFTRHVDRWKTLPLEENWAYYAKAIALLMRRLRVRLAAQESGLYPFLPVQPGGPPVAMPPSIDYAAEAYKIRRQIWIRSARAHIDAAQVNRAGAAAPGPQLWTSARPDDESPARIAR